MSTLPSASQQQLRQFIEQIDQLEAEKKAIGDDIKEKFLEAKAVGFDVKIMRQVLKLRRKSMTERQEEEGLLETYLHALGMLADVADKVGPLGEAAFERAVDPRQVSTGKPKIEGDGYLDKVRVAYEAATKRGSDIMRMPDGISVFPISVVKSTLVEYGAISP